MAYIKRDIEDRIAEGDDIFKVEKLEEDKIKLIPSPTNVTTVGTAINKGFLDVYENTLEEHDKSIDGIKDLSLIKSEIVDLIYPIGSIYMSINNTDPSVLFGGRWYKIESRMLLGASATYPLNTTGGSSTHSHDLTKAPVVACWDYLVGARDPNSQTSFMQTKYTTDFSGYWDNNSTYYTISHWNGETRDHTGESHGGGVRLHGTTNSDLALPPYLAVNIWKRTA